MENIKTQETFIGPNTNAALPHCMNGQFENTNSLDTLVSQIQSASQTFPAIEKLVTTLLTTQEQTRLQNEMLEARLTDCMNEIIALQRNAVHTQTTALKDPLTGIGNRAMFDKAINYQMAKAKSTNEPLCLILADIDHFKNFNDEWGHQTGDHVLQLVSEILLSHIKCQHILARYGGEEFAILLPKTPVNDASHLAEEIRQSIEATKLSIQHIGDINRVITMSLGISLYTDDDTATSFIRRADECLYAAKDAGRNKIVAEKKKSKLQGEASYFGRPIKHPVSAE